MLFLTRECTQSVINGLSQTVTIGSSADQYLGLLHVALEN